MNPSDVVVPFCFESNEVRVINQDGELWFVAADVCRILEIQNPSDALKNLDEDEYTRFNLGYHDESDKRSMSHIGRQGNPNVNIISESGLYTLIIRSNKPQAKPFRRWVTHEVLPSIRKTGVYDLRQRKDVSVSHTHTRSTSAPGGLDIKYTLDLTKVITRPNRQGLAILERLTGIDFKGIELGVEQEGLSGEVRRYLLERCRREPSGRVSLKQLYGNFHIWYRENVDGRAGAMPSSKRFNQELRYLGLECKPSGGRFYAYGLVLVEEVRS